MTIYNVYFCSLVGRMNHLCNATSKTFSPQTIALTRKAKLWEDTRDSQGNWPVECRIGQ